MARIILTAAVSFCSIVAVNTATVPVKSMPPADNLALALTTDLTTTDRGHNWPFIRDSPPSTTRLLNDCPHGPTGNADACTFEPDGRVFNVYGYDTTNAARNCDGGTTTFSRGFLYSKLTGSTFSLGTSGSVKDSFSSIPVGISIKVGASYATDYYSRMDVDETDYVSPGRQSALLAQQQYTRHTGRIRVNYGKRVAGHYIWYVNGVNNDVPTSDKQTVLRQFNCNVNIQAEVRSYNQHPTVRQIS